MPTAIALHWNANTLHYVVAESDRIEAAASVALEPRMDPTAVGRRLAEVLSPYSPGRAKVVVAMDRSALEWQHLSLPPCPADELPDLVRLQADREQSPTDDDLGFDFFPLVGDEQTPQEVLTVAVEPAKLAKIRLVCNAANLTLERIVPLATGWPVITQQASPSVKLGTQIFVALQTSEATLWATRAGRVVLFRTFQIPTGDDSTTLASTLRSELRRTLLALSQHAGNNGSSVSLLGNQSDRLAPLAQTLDAQLDVSVQSLDVAAQYPILSKQEASVLPLAGFAIDESRGTRPLVDLLNPRRRPKKQINFRTYALAATAGVLLLAMLGWSSYTKLNAPLAKAAEDQAEITLLEDSLDGLQEQVKQAAAIRDWTAAAPNLLLHLDQVSKSLRPLPLKDKDFSGDQDVVLDKLHLEKRQLTIDALTRNSRAVQPLETRLRASAYRPERLKSDASKTLKKYPWHLKSTIEITTASDHLDTTMKNKAASDSKTEEPQS